MPCVTPLQNNTRLCGKHEDITRVTNDPGDKSRAGREEHRHAATEMETIKAGEKNEMITWSVRGGG